MAQVVSFKPSRYHCPVSIFPMKAMKTMKAIKAMKAMKGKRVSKIAHGKMSKALVFRGSKEKTVGGITKSGLMRNRYGRIVSRKQSAAAAKRAKSSGFGAWTKAVGRARKELGLKGFVAIGGKSAAGKALYAKAKAF